jgi:hypothetical protein
MLVVVTALTEAGPELEPESELEPEPQAANERAMTEKIAAEAAREMTRDMIEVFLTVNYADFPNVDIWKVRKYICAGVLGTVRVLPIKCDITQKRSINPSC